MRTRSLIPSYGSGITRRRFLKGVAAGAGAAALVACGSGSPSGLKFDDAADARQPGTVWSAKNDWRLADETKDAVPGGIYRGFRTADQTGHYDALTLAPSQVPYSAHVHEFLLARNRGPGIDPTSVEAGQPVPMLAEAWEISADGMTVTFTMRPGVKFHPVAPVNGRVMDIDDWKTSVEAFLKKGNQNQALTEVLSRAEYPDARHMVWKLNYPYAPIISRIWSERFAHVIMPKELNTNQALAESRPIGTGYKILDNHQPAITMDYRKHNEYWGGSPLIDRWHVPIIPEYANRYAQFVNGNIMDFQPTARDVLLLAKDAPQTVIVADEISDENVSRIRFGRTSPQAQPWADPRVRVAMRRSINFRAIGEFLSNKAQFEAAGIPVEATTMTHLPQQASYWLNPDKGELGALSGNYLYNVAEAKKLNAAAGYNDPIELNFYVLAERGEVPETDQLVMDSLGSAGTFRLVVHRSADATAHMEYRSHGRFDGLVAQSATSEDADYFIYRDYHSQGNIQGSQAYPDPRIDKVAEAQRREFNVQKRIELLKEFQMIAAELMPAIPGRDLFTAFRFRWPWLRNSNHGYPQGVELPSGRPVLGGHKQWLDPAMPSRDKGAT